MPNRRLPRTFEEIAIALQQAERKADNTKPEQLAFGQDTLTRLKSFSPQYSKEMQEKAAALSKQSEASKARNEALGV